MPDRDQCGPTYKVSRTEVNVDSSSPSLVSALETVFCGGMFTGDSNFTERKNITVMLKTERKKLDKTRPFG